MGRKRHTAEQIIGKLRSAEIELATGLGTAAGARKLGSPRQTYYRWRRGDGGGGCGAGSAARGGTWDGTDTQQPCRIGSGVRGVADALCRARVGGLWQSLGFSQGGRCRSLARKRCNGAEYGR